jgi:hypothetical protein
MTGSADRRHVSLASRAEIPAVRPACGAVLAPRLVVGGGRPGLGGLWLVLVPLACCGGPLLIVALAASGALAWAAPGLGAGVIVAATVLVIHRTRRGRARRETGMTGWAREAGPEPARPHPRAGRAAGREAGESAGSCTTH